MDITVIMSFVLQENDHFQDAVLWSCIMTIWRFDCLELGASRNPVDPVICACRTLCVSLV